MDAAVISWFRVTVTQLVPLKYSSEPLLSSVVICTLANASPSTSLKVPKSLSPSSMVVPSEAVTASLVDVGASFTGVTVIDSVPVAVALFESLTV